MTNEFFFLIYETEFVLFLAVLENFVLPLAWDKDVKSDVTILNLEVTSLISHYNKHWKTFVEGCDAT